MAKETPGVLGYDCCNSGGGICCGEECCGEAVGLEPENWEEVEPGRFRRLGRLTWDELDQYRKQWNNPSHIVIYGAVVDFDRQAGGTVQEAVVWIGPPGTDPPRRHPPR